MALESKDRAFRCDAISRIDYKTLTMDRVLTAFLARLVARGSDQPDAPGHRPRRRCLPRAARRRQDRQVRGVRRQRGHQPPLGRHPFAGPGQPWPGYRGRGWPTAAARVRVPAPQRGPVASLRCRRAALRAVAINDVALQGLARSSSSPTSTPVTGEAVPGPDIDVESQALLNMVEATQGKAQDRPR